jgi:Tol biopolymer transport system component
VSNASGNLDIYLQRVGGQKAINLTEDSPADDTQPAFSPDGALIAFRSERDISFDPELESVVGEPVAIVPGSRSQWYPDVSPDGRWVAFSFFFQGGQGDLAVVGTEGAGLRQLTDEPHFSNFGPRWSPDGSELVFYSGRSGDFELWSIRPDGSGLRQLTEARSRITIGTWSPDGRRIAYWSLDSENHLFEPALPWKEQSPEKLPRPPEGHFFLNSWSPDGGRIAGNVFKDDWTASRIAVFSLASQEYEVFPVEGVNPRWLSDGHRVLFANGEKLFLLDVETGRAKEILERAGLEADNLPAISPDNRTIYFGIARSEADIWMVTLDEGANR